MDDLKKMPFSRAGKATINMYRAFQDQDKHKNVESKVAKFIGKEKADIKRNDSEQDEINMTFN